MDLKSIYEILDNIVATGNFTPEMLDSIEKLKDEFDEREGMLKKEDKETDSEDLKSKYEELQKNYDTILKERDDYMERANRYRDRYISRFMGEDDSDHRTDAEEIKRDTEKDVKRDGKVQSFDELFKEREG